MLHRCLRLLSTQSDKAAFLELVKTLRYRTEAPLSDCSSALKEANNDIEEAIKLLQRKGAALAIKKNARVTENGFVMRCVWNGTGNVPNSIGAAISICSETDFAARSEPFQRACMAIQRELHTLLSESDGKLFDKGSDSTGKLKEGEREEKKNLNLDASSTAFANGNNNACNMNSSDEEVLHKLQERSSEIIHNTIAVLGENVRISCVVPLRSSLPSLPALTALHDSNVVIGSYVHGGVDNLQSATVAKSNEEDEYRNKSYSNEIGRIVGLVALSPRVKQRKSVDPTPTAVKQSEAAQLSNDLNATCVTSTNHVKNKIDGKLVDAVARHFVATCGSEKDWRQEPFFGTTDGEETIAHWLKRHGLQLTGSLVVEFGKDPIVHLP